ncbi:MAG: hypothetical protein Kow0029_13690 [Candidatus Rifleibacteriota bacterium]
MKIIQIINALTFGGAQIILLDLAEELIKNHHEVKVVSFRDGPIGKKLRELGCSTQILKETVLDIPAFIALRKTVKQFKPQIIHSHLFRATIWARIAINSWPDATLITSIHGKESSFFHMAERLTCSKTDHFIFPSDFLKDWYLKNIRKFSDKKLSVVYPGVEISGYRPILKHNDLTIGTLSRLHPVKGIDRLLRAAAILRTRGLKFKVAIGGEGKQKHELSILAKNLMIDDICDFYGEIEDRSGFLDKLDIFVAASREEAFGIHVCEAMERGLPVVATRIGGLPEIVENNISGYLVEPDNYGMLADKLELLLKNDSLRFNFGTASRKIACRNFNRKEAIKKHMAIYNSATNSDKRIHFAISSGEFGGGEHLALDLMQSMISRGWIVSATCCKGILAEKLAKAKIRYNAVSAKAGGIFFAARLIKDILCFKPKILNSHLNRASLFSGILGQLFDIPVVSHVHGLNKLSYYEKSDRLICVSTAVSKHLLSQGADPAKLATIVNSVPPKRLIADRVLEKPMKVMILAKLHKNKGHFWALKTIFENSHSLPEIELHLVGDGPERKHLEELYKKHKDKMNCTFYGYLENVDAILSKMHVALLPSLGEGIPLSLLEAMNYGIPCIATRVGGIPEIITHGLNGILIENQNSKQLLAALNAISNPETYSRMSQNAKAEFFRLNRHDEMIDKIEKILLEAIASAK